MNIPGTAGEETVIIAKYATAREKNMESLPGQVLGQRWLECQMRCFLASCMAPACHESTLDVAVASVEGSRAVDVLDNETCRVVHMASREDMSDSTRRY